MSSDAPPPNEPSPKEHPTFYFNGEALPKWTACLVACEHKIMRRMDDTGGHFWTFYFSRMSFRLDHDESVESEDPLVFQVCISEALRFFLEEKRRAIRNLRDCSKMYGVPGRVIYRDVVDGMIRMLELVTRDQLAFWVNGNEECRQWLLDTVRRHRLPREHPDYQEATHVERERREGRNRLCDLHQPLYRSSALADNGIMDRVHEILRSFPQLHPPDNGS